MQSRRLDSVRPTEEQLKAAFRWANDSVSGLTWRTRGTQVSWGRFLEDAEHGSIAHFMGVHRRTGALCAYSCIFGMNLRAFHAQLGVLSNPEYIGSGLGAELGVLTVAWAFQRYPLRKIYLEMPKVNARSLARMLNSYAELEAELPEHTYLDGQLVATSIYSISRRIWESFASERLALLVGYR